MAALLLLPSCNGKSAATPAIGNLTPGGTGGPPVTNSAQPPVELAAQLRQSLSAEFERLGIDPDKVAAAAPSGTDNAVFNLAATVIDPDGPPDGHGGGELPPTGIELTWTERIIGDYDQNGEVNYSDITPLGLHFNSPVEYDDPALHGGFDAWPTGDLDEADPGAKASAEANWRLARIDGESNGELNFGDVTPLALHWHERLSGYRVYRKSPGEAEFSVVEQEGSPADYTVEHPASPPADKPVQYVLSDDEAAPGGLGDGDYAYYVVPYDALSGTEGPASAVLTVNLTTQVVNQSPVARISVDPGFAGAPAEITLDASESYDLDGSIAAFEWDFDADGTPDWLSTDPVPEASSGGTVDDITPGADGVVTVTYNQGSADWYYPSVAAIDDKGASSQPAPVKLGISGWIDSEVIYKESETPFSFLPDNYYYNDVAHQPVCIGNSEDQRTLYYAQRTGVEQWQEEVVFNTDHPVIKPFVGTTPIVFDYAYPSFKDDGQPVLAIELAWGAFDYQSAIFISERNAKGEWKTSLLYDSPPGFSKPGPGLPAKTGVNEFLIPASEVYGTIQENGAKSRTFVIEFSNGIQHIEEASYSDNIITESLFQLNQGKMIGADGIWFILIQYVDWGDPQPEFHLLRRNGPDDYSLEVVNCSSLPGISEYLEIHTMQILADGTKYYLTGNGNAVRNYNSELYLIEQLGQQLTKVDIPIQYETGSTGFTHLTPVSFGELVSVVYESGGLPDELKSYAQSFLIEGSSVIVEDIYRTQGDSDDLAFPVGVGEIFESPELGITAVITQYLSRGAFMRKRVDPRLQ